MSSHCYKLPVVLLFVLLASRAEAGGRVELVLVGDSQVGAEFHQWLESLSRAGAARVSLRAAQDTDQVGIVVQGTADRPVYVVTGKISGHNELILPGGRFQRSDMPRLARWIADLAENGPPDRRAPKSAFGLTVDQLELARTDLGQTVGFSTQGVGRAEAVGRIGRQLKQALQVDAETVKTLGDDPVAEELSSLTCGTALACLTRPAGLGLAPRAAGRQVAYVVAEAKAGAEVWPIGWPPHKQGGEVLPAMFVEMHTVNIQGVSAAKAMTAIAEKLKVPLLLDHNALARFDIDPEKVNVSVPRANSTYDRFLRRMLIQARLKSELRVDDAGTPFLWVTSLKPIP